jgi:hypothetical protein
MEARKRKRNLSKAMCGFARSATIKIKWRQILVHAFAPLAGQKIWTLLTWFNRWLIRREAWMNRNIWTTSTRTEVKHLCSNLISHRPHSTNLNVHKIWQVHQAAACLSTPLIIQIRLGSEVIHRWKVSSQALTLTCMEALPICSKAFATGAWASSRIWMAKRFVWSVSKQTP